MVAMKSLRTGERGESHSLPTPSWQEREGAHFLPQT